MGNQSNKRKLLKDNRIIVEFMTPQQKFEKTHQLIRFQEENEQTNDENSEFELIGNELSDYTVEFKKIIYTDQDKIDLNILHSYILNPSINISAEWNEISSYFEANVKSYQIFFNNQEIKNELQIYQFNLLEPLIVEIVFRKKHWMERTHKNICRLFRRIGSFLNDSGKVIAFAQPIISTVAIMNPFIVPTLKTMKIGAVCMGGKYQHLIVQILNSIIYGYDKASQLVPQSKFTCLKEIPFLIGLFAGGVQLGYLKYLLFIFFPFLTPVAQMLQI